MTDLPEIWPPFGLRLTTGPPDLRVVTDADLSELTVVIGRGVHDPAYQPSFYPWTDVPAHELPGNTARHFWAERSTFAPAKWSLEFAVHLDGVLVGCQGVSTEECLVTRTGETGSWFGRAHQGQGIGTRMRQAVCTLAFDQLSFCGVTSAASDDNAASVAVSRKVGYVDNGVPRVERRGGPARELRLTPEAFVRGRDRITVTGVEVFHAFTGLTD